MVAEKFPQNESQQLAILTRLRYSHHKKLIEPGIARRILELDVPINKQRDASNFTEGTLFYPSRRYFLKIPNDQLFGTKYSIAANCSKP